MIYLILAAITIIGGAVILAAWLAFVVLAVIAGVLYGLYQVLRDWRADPTARVAEGRRANVITDFATGLYHGLRRSQPAPAESTTDTAAKDQTNMQAMIMKAARKGTTR